MDQLQQWLFKGNPVLKAAIAVLVIGVILLLRFATEHWQLSLAVKLWLVAAVSAGITLLGYALDAIGANKAHTVDVFTHYAIGSHPALLRGLHGSVQRMQTVAGDPLGTAIVLSVVGDTASLEVVGGGELAGAHAVIFAGVTP